ncbi:hypothetical protein C8J57DRAFT_1245007 [Mycena rebaudengoi]|nr:hypothetical protein C8J57DRAFT_1245007 [Mycena rebaudengoi]
MASASTVDTDETQNSSVPAINSFSLSYHPILLSKSKFRRIKPKGPPTANSKRDPRDSFLRCRCRSQPQKIEGYCYNKGLVKQTGETDNVKTAPKPAAKYAIDIFSEEKKDQIAARVAELMEGADKAPGKNLTVWHTAREELLDSWMKRRSCLSNDCGGAQQQAEGWPLTRRYLSFGPFVAGVYRDYLNDLRTFALRTGLKSWCQEVLLVALKDAGMVHVSIDESHEPRLHRWTEDTPLRRCCWNLRLESATYSATEWFKETVPEKTDGIVIKMDLKSEETTSSSSYEQHCPANMMSNH